MIKESFTVKFSSPKHLVPNLQAWSLLAYFFSSSTTKQNAESQHTKSQAESVWAPIYFHAQTFKNIITPNPKPWTSVSEWFPSYLCNNQSQNRSLLVHSCHEFHPANLHAPKTKSETVPLKLTLYCSDSPRLFQPSTPITSGPRALHGSPWVQIN